jgi:hypothetical protein
MAKQPYGRMFVGTHYSPTLRPQLKRNHWARARFSVVLLAAWLSRKMATETAKPEPGGLASVPVLISASGFVGADRTGRIHHIDAFFKIAAYMQSAAKQGLDEPFPVVACRPQCPETRCYSVGFRPKLATPKPLNTPGAKPACRSRCKMLNRSTMHLLRYRAGTLWYCTPHTASRSRSMATAGSCVMRLGTLDLV